MTQCTRSIHPDKLVLEWVAQSGDERLCCAGVADLAQRHGRVNADLAFRVRERRDEWADGLWTAEQAQRVRTPGADIPVLIGKRRDKRLYRRRPQASERLGGILPCGNVFRVSRLHAKGVDEGPNRLRIADQTECSGGILAHMRIHLAEGS